jgi:hypothetical protein
MGVMSASEEGVVDVYVLGVSVYVLGVTGVDVLVV